MTEAFVQGGVRAPVGSYGGSLSHLRTEDLLGQTMVAACRRVGVPLDRIEDIAAGCVNVAHEGMGDIARWGALTAGFPDSVPAVTVNRFCGSSLTAAIGIAHAIRSNELDVGLAAGVESMPRSGWAQMKGDAPFSKALRRAGLAPADIDVWEVHEAFAAQALGVLRELPVMTAPRSAQFAVVGGSPPPLLSVGVVPTYSLFRRPMPATTTTT